MKTEKKELYQKLFKIVLPIAFQNLMLSLVSASDAFMLGFLDQDSLSASSLAGQVMFVCSLFYTAFVSGCNVLASQYWGRNNKHAVDEILAITMRYSFLIGLIFSLCTCFMPEQIMKIFTSDNYLIQLGADYLKTVSLSYVLTGFLQAYFGIMKICDKAGLSSLIGSVGVILNIILNACFIFGINMGIKGAALATVFASIFQVILVLLVILQKKL